MNKYFLMGKNYDKTAYFNFISTLACIIPKKENIEEKKRNEPVFFNKLRDTLYKAFSLWF